MTCRSLFTDKFLSLFHLAKKSKSST